MSEMVERVAAAIEKGIADLDLRGPGPLDYPSVARAAIEAMRLPTFDQLEACGNHAVGRIIWQQMIGEALKD